MNARRSRAMNLVASIGTAVGCVGVFHALYDSLRGDGAGPVPAGVEAGVASLFLEGVVVVCASRARTHAAGSRAAKLDVAVVLLAAGVSGLVSGLHAGWGTAGLLRFAVPIIAAVVWLGDIIAVLRTRARDDGEQLLRRVVTTVGRHTLATSSGRSWRIRRSDRALVRAMCAFEAGGGARDQLVTRLDGVHHRADLLSPMGRSPWRPAERAETTLAVSSSVPRMLPWPPVADGEVHGPDPDRDPLVETAKTLVSADPDMGRRRLVEQLRDQGHQVGTERAKELLRSARSTRLNGTSREEN